MVDGIPPNKYYGLEFASYLIKNKEKHANHRKIIQINLLLLFHQNQVKIYEIFSLDKQLEEI